VGCNHQFLARHTWSRRVTHTESHPVEGTDQWGRRTVENHAVCHAEYVCQSCGEVRDEGDCLCDQARADQCPVRLDYLARGHGVNA
jgi:hypothetical protein